MNEQIEINFYPSKKQSKALDYLFDDTTLFVGYGGGAFSGKSYLACYWLTIMCISFPDTAWGLGRKELTTLKKTTLITLFKVFKECGIKPERDYMYNQQRNIIEFNNDSIIFLLDMAYNPSDPLFTRFGGLDLTGAAVDESAESEHKAIDILFTRLGRRNNKKYGLKKKLLETFNPDKGHVYTRYYLPHKEGNESVNTKFVPALPKDNPSEEVEEYINDIIATGSKETIERLIYGNFEYDDDPAKLINYDSIVSLFSNYYVPDGQGYITADVARYGSDRAVIMVWSGYRVEEIHSFDKSSVTEIISLIQNLCVRYSVPMHNVIADEDGVGGGVVDVLRCKGFVNNSKAIEESKENAIQYKNLKAQCYYHLANVINDNKMYICSSDYDEIIKQELEHVKSYNMDKEQKLQIIPKEKVKEIIGRSPDFSDALMMRMYFDLAPTKFSKTTKLF